MSKCFKVAGRKQKMGKIISVCPKFKRVKRAEKRYWKSGGQKGYLIGY